MSQANVSRLEQEWITLQNQFDSYEKCALFIKLLCIVTTMALLFIWPVKLWTLSMIAIFWLQDAIWKTFQSRIGQQLEYIEGILHESQTSKLETTPGMQFNLTWTQSRPNALGLIKAYLSQACKPTVAYPYVVLMLLSLVYCCFG